MTIAEEPQLLVFVRKVLGDRSPTLQLDDLDATTSFTEIGADSLDLASLVVAIEDELDIFLPEDELIGVDTVRALSAVVRRHASA